MEKTFIQNNDLSSFQILIVLGGNSDGDDRKVISVLEEIGFAKKVLFGEGEDVMQNLYSAFFIGKTAIEIMRELSDTIQNKCEKNNVGMFHYLMIDATKTSKLAGVWHDGYY